MGELRDTAARLAGGVAAAGAAAAAYMVYEAQAVQCRRADLTVPGLPPAWSGVTVLHLSDVHAGLFPTNERSLAKVVGWAEVLGPDLVVLTGDILGDPQRSRSCLDLLGRLQPPLGMFAVTGNHEYGLGKGPLARARDVSALWEQAGICLLRDRCVTLPPRRGTTLALCGADYLSGGFGLRPPPATWAETAAPRAAEPASTPAPPVIFPILLIHEPPPSEGALAALFPLVFAGHTHGGQLRVPRAGGLAPLHREEGQPPAGVHPWGLGSLVVSRGIGTSFVPFRLLTRPEATLWRLV
jgi:hypothetical protein